MTATAWTNLGTSSTFFGAVSNVLYDESGRTYNATEQVTTSGKRYYDGLTPTQVNLLVPSTTQWTNT